MLIKKGGLKNLINHTAKMPMRKSPLNKTASPHVRSFIKKRLQHQCPPPPPPSPPKKTNKQTRKTSKNILLYRTPPIMAAAGETQNIIYFKSQRAILI